MNDIVSWFHLKSFPFDKDIKTSNIYKSKALEEVTARFDFMKQRGGIMLVTGDPGVGKSVAIRTFVDSLNSSRYHPIYTPLTTLQGADLLRHLNDKLGLTNRASKAVIYRQLQETILEIREQRNKTLVLIIDEAHLLNVGAFQELRLLTNFNIDSYDPYILILAGQSELKRTMDYAIMEPFAQRLSMRYHMSALNSEEVNEYVEKRLKLAGAREPIFEEQAINALYELSFGIPRRIGALACNAMTHAMFQQQKMVSADSVISVKQGG